ncbi:hypothetical protein K505DRAFT_355635 [Melanomma pulvis-pyrius CBS 109.77]|uniref:Beta/gamma crystallin 'Greek key' domain-containing protein n=1 Tax=Melanomma pulvis-pyrius CBS 109.77 TaxID=1314802 RepID=A0A6A6XX15_9PLEO|nr:hypothetical protein K505DRAFT_355635 [Melanomma pulvis-pyrius CBS 109.77]
MQFKLQLSLLAVSMLASTTLSAVVMVPEVRAIESPTTALSTSVSSMLEARVATLITVCKDTNFGNCNNFAGDVNHDLPADWIDKASSVRAFPGLFCYIYQDYSCGGFRGGPVQDDNAHDDLGKVNWNDKTSSWLCLYK